MFPIQDTVVVSCFICLVLYMPICSAHVHFVECWNGPKVVEMLFYQAFPVFCSVGGMVNKVECPTKEELSTRAEPWTSCSVDHTMPEYVIGMILS